MAVEIDVVYLGKVACRAVHVPSGSELRTVAPKDNGGDGSTFSPTDLMATALGACVTTIMAMVAERRGLDLVGTEVRVEKHMTAEPPRRIARLPVVVTFKRPIDAETAKILEAAAHGCPVHRSLHPDIDAPIVFRIPPA
ncbi:MAG TPA: OsmC family protein [Planctomycetota bacterium]|nr:OsmC family protein [Planctomycetota bacterium]